MKNNQAHNSDPKPRVAILTRYQTDWEYKTDRLAGDKRIVIFGNDAGGVGKSLCAEYAGIMFEELNIKFHFIECETKERIAHKFGENALYHEYDKDGQEANPDAAGVYWDDFAIQLTRSDNAVVDLSANAVKNFARWALTGSGEVYLQGGEQLTFVCPMTDEPKALDHARLNLLDMKEAFPKARRILLLNSIHGHLYETDPRVELLKLETGATVYVMPRNTAPAWGAMKALGRYDEVGAYTTEDLIAKGISGGPAARSVKTFRQFSSDMIQLMAKIAKMAVVSEGSTSSLTRGPTVSNGTASVVPSPRPKAL